MDELLKNMYIRVGAEKPGTWQVKLITMQVTHALRQNAIAGQ